MRLIEVTFPDHCTSDVMRAVEEAEPVFHRLFEPDDDDIRLLKVFFGKDDTQGFIDKLQSVCNGSDNWRILILPVEGTAPALDKPEDEKKQKRVALREEIYSDVADGADLSTDFFLLTLASTIVAAVGLNADSVAAVIGAMVIAPLLGPILAFSFATALGDGKLSMRSARNAVLGLLVGTGAAVVIGLIIPVNLESEELVSRTIVGIDSIALALAAGGAAALSISTGVAGALVGVMVAVALLPPAAAIGLFVGAGEFVFAARSALLLTVNVICIMLAAQGVYAFKGIRPRTWLEKKSAEGAVRNNIIILGLLLAAAAAVIILTQTSVLPDMDLPE
ncbi:TIGR00341 family protein [Parvularcula marina]|uniref:TIGR00341 family protein n=1 Tax=Parvularcula marina TaxID=2292771 RepID=UPI00351562A0